MDWQKKPNYGKTPEYLNKIKENIQGEYKMIQNLHEKYNDQKYLFAYLGTVFQRRKSEKFVKGSSESGTK